MVDLISLLNPVELTKGLFSWSQRPRPEITFEYDLDNSGNDYCHLRFNTSSGKETWFFRFRVNNLGKKMIKNADVRVEKIELIDSRGVKQKVSSPPFFLHWANELTDNSRSIYTQTPAFVDFIYTENVKPGRANFFPKSKHVGAGIKSFITQGLWVITIKLLGENIEPVEKSVRVDFNGNWNQIKIEMENLNSSSKNKRNRIAVNKWWQNPTIIVPSTAVIFAAIIGASWWSDIFPILFKDQTKIEQEESLVKSSLMKTGDALRPLEPLETGKKISELPNGVYFFAFPDAVEYEIEDNKKDFIEASNKRKTNSHFELQKNDNRYYIIGFIGDESYSNLGSLNSEKTHYTAVFPISWGGATHAIAIPFDAIYTISARTVNLDEKTDIIILDIGFEEVKINPEIH